MEKEGLLDECASILDEATSDTDADLEDTSDEDIEGEDSETLDEDSAAKFLRTIFPRYYLLLFLLSLPAVLILYFQDSSLNWWLGIKQLKNDYKYVFENRCLTC